MLDLPHQFPSDPVSTALIVHHQSANLNPVVGFEELREESMNPACQSAVWEDRDQ